jgi:hypothetical protein
MGKYIHKFDTSEEFFSTYSDTDTIKTVSVICENGTYVYDGFRSIDIGGARLNKCHIWKKDNAYYFTYVRNPNVGDKLGYEGYSISSRYETITATNVVSSEPGYIEPWVSYTVETGGISYNHQHPMR